ncbi:MAG: transglycosylase SLT domain-containing protein [Stellaceae bacterium]
MPAPSHPLPSGTAIDPTISRGLRQASAATSIDFGFLLSTATQESGLHADAKSGKGTATGLFQFIESTWLQMVQRFGAKYGIGDLAQQVSLDGTGHAHVADPAARQQILDLRTDPRLAAAFAAEYTKENKTEVERALGRPVGNTDLYMAHFLGAGGATEFLKAMRSSAGTIAADLLPEAAALNHAVFYDNRTGAPRTVAEIYQGFADKFAKTAHALEAMASATDASASPAVPAAKPASGGFATLLGRVGTIGAILSQPMRPLLDVLAASAMRLIGNRSATADRRHRGPNEI